MDSRNGQGYIKQEQGRQRVNNWHLSKSVMEYVSDSLSTLALFSEKGSILQ